MNFSISTKLGIIIFMIILSSLMGVFGTFQINKLSTLHKLNFLHLKYNQVFFEHVIDYESNIESVDIFRQDLLLIKAQPVGCLNTLGPFEQALMKSLKTYKAVELCINDIALADRTLVSLDAYEQGNISEKTLAKALAEAKVGFQTNSEQFQPLVDKTQDFILNFVFISLFTGSTGILVFSIFLTKSIRSDYRRLSEAEKEVSQKEALLKLIINAIPAGINYIDLNENYKFANEWYLKSSNISEKDLKRKKVKEVIGNKVYSKAKKNIRYALAGNVVNVINKMTNADGTEMTIIVKYVPHRDENGEICGFISLIQDITEQNEKEKNLQRAEKKLNSILRLAPEGFITADIQGNIQHFSKGAERIFGYTEEEISGKNINLLLPENLHSVHRKHLDNFLISEEQSIEMDKRRPIIGLRKDGLKFDMIASVAKVELEDETLFTVVLLDITKEKKYRKELEVAKEDAELANYAKTKFLANMSHELRTPLNAIIGYSQMIKSQLLGPVGEEKYVEYAQIIAESGDHLLSIISNILDLSKIEAGKLPFFEETLDLEKIISECYNMLATLSQKKQLQMKVDISDKNLRLNADKIQINQILLNLLSNSIKFTPEGGTITTRFYLDKKGGIDLSISDTGVGIPQEDISKIIEPFVIVQNDPLIRENQYQGTGLGLSISNMLSNNHDAQFCIESEVDKGTVVRIIFPPERTVRG